MKRFFLVSFLLLLTACNSISFTPGQQASSASTTPSLSPNATASLDCGCSIDGPRRTPTGGISSAGPAAGTTVTPPGNAADQNAWKTYQNAAVPFRFEYPSAYDSDPYATCSVKAENSGNSPSAISLGSQIQIVFTKADQTDLTAVLETFEKDPSRQSFQFDPVETRKVGDVDALVLSYRSDPNAQPAKTAFLINQGMLYQISVGSNLSGCDVTDAKIAETDVFAHLLDTFKFQ
jgi:hypothetical protein